MRLHRIIFCNETVACVQRQTPPKGLPDSEARQTATGSRWALREALHRPKSSRSEKRSGRPLGSSKLPLRRPERRRSAEGHVADNSPSPMSSRASESLPVKSTPPSALTSTSSTIPRSHPRFAETPSLHLMSSFAPVSPRSVDKPQNTTLAPKRHRMTAHTVANRRDDGTSRLERLRNQAMSFRLDARHVPQGDHPSACVRRCPHPGGQTVPHALSCVVGDDHPSHPALASRSASLSSPGR